MEPISFLPIGTFYSNKTRPYQAARQATESQMESLDRVELDMTRLQLDSLRHLEQFSHIWLIYVFKKQNWHNLVSPPRGPYNKVGVFASRSPYRPNPIGISAVKLMRIEGPQIWIGANDLLDGTLILDIKPYLPYADAVDANEGWLKDLDQQKYEIIFSDYFLKQVPFFENSFSEVLIHFVRQQLEYEPTNKQKKRIKKLDASQYVLSYQTWRILFSIDEQNIEIKSIHSGYSEKDLDSDEDPYQDKILHRKFFQTFPT